MFRQVSSRNHRNKGLKVKHALQIFLLVAVCLWLLYQVKHSHDEKKAFEERNAKELQNRQDTLKLGRKDLREGGRISSDHIVNNQLEEEKEGEEEEDDQSKHDKNDHEDNMGGDDADHNHEEKSVEESEIHEDTVEKESQDKKEEGEEDESKEREVEDENKEREVKDENKERAVEDENKEREVEDINEEREVEDENKEGNEQEEGEESKGNAHEAREAHYTGDDASSAVVKLDTKTVTELNLEKSDDEHKEDDKNVENIVNNTENISNSTLDSTISQDRNNDNSTSSVVENEIGVNATAETNVESGHLQLSKIESKEPSNTTAERVELGAHLETSGNTTLLNSTATEGTDQILKDNNSLVGTDAENASLPEVKDASVKSPSLDQNTMSETGKTTNQENATIIMGNDTTVAIPLLDHNATSEIEKITDQESHKLNIELPDLTEQHFNIATEESSEMLAKNATSEGSRDQAENLKASEESGESEDDSTVDDKSDIDIVRTEESQTSEVTHEVREALTDLGTLPESDTNGQSIEDVAAE